MSDEIQFKCDECGDEFPADPNAMIEWEMKCEYIPDGEAKEIGFSQADLEAMNEFDLKSVGITPEQRRVLLGGKTIKWGGCICLECQDAMMGEVERED